MKRKLFIVILCITMLSSNIVYGVGEEDVIAPVELGIPQYVNLEAKDNYFLIGWKNPENVINMINIDYQIDFKLGRGEWQSVIKELPSDYLYFNPEAKSSVAFDPVIEGMSKQTIDLENHSYSFRIRYKYNYVKDGVNSSILGPFSSPVTLGLQSFYQNASNWAVLELDMAVKYDLIPDCIREDMKANITREEFSEIVVKMYELQTGKTINFEGQTFKDTNNIEVLKAAKLGIVKGVGWDNFAPTNPVTRQEIAVMLKRTLALLYPEMDFSYKVAVSDPKVASWAVKEVSFMVEQGVLKGDEKGLINPIGHTTREQAVILTLRTYDKFK